MPRASGRGLRVVDRIKKFLGGSTKATGEMLPAVVPGQGVKDVATGSKYLRSKEAARAGDLTLPGGGGVMVGGAKKGGWLDWLPRFGRKGKGKSSAKLASNNAPNKITTAETTAGKVHDTQQAGNITNTGTFKDMMSQHWSRNSGKYMLGGAVGLTGLGYMGYRGLTSGMRTMSEAPLGDRLDYYRELQRIRTGG